MARVRHISVGEPEDYYTNVDMLRAGVPRARLF
jgi:hypothetical protein